MPPATLAEKLDKIRSPNLQSQQQTAIVLSAVEATLKEQNTEATPTAYLAALLALLNQANASGESDPKKSIPTAVVYLLDIVTPFAPQGLLRAKFTQIVSLLAPVLSQPETEAPTVRPSIGCLESLLKAQDSAAWELSAAQISPRRAIAALLTLAIDHRPKVRKRAQDALRNVLRNPPPSPSLDHPAAGMCAETAMKSLADLAQRSAQMRKEKKGSDPLHSPDLIHALQLVKVVASASGGWPSKKIEDLCELLLGIARNGNEHMTMAVFEIFEMIFAGMADGIASAKLPRLLEIISELRPAPNDTQLLPPWIAILSRGYDVFAQVEPEETFQRLPDLFVLVSEFLESHSKNIRISASECMISFVANCIPSQVILEPSIYDEKILEKLAKVVEGLLTVKYQSAWLETFNVIGAMFDSLRWRASPYLLEVTRTVGEMRGNDSFSGKKEADVVLGKAIRAMGPDVVLNILPLNLANPAKGQPGRAWLLPLLRDYTTNTRLGHFRSELVPLSEIMFQRVLDHGQAEKTMEVKIYETVVQQIWSILPGYCDLPLDLTEAFDQSFAEMLANLLYQQAELRLDICRALKALVESNQAVASIEEEEDDLLLQSRVTKAAARSNLEYLSNFSSNLLAVLFNIYGTTIPQKRGPILQTINAYLSITPPKELTETFERVCKMLATALQEAVAQPQQENAQKAASQIPSTTHTLMDLVIAMAIYLPRENYSALFEIASLVIFKDDDAQLQKKAYKLIPRLAESPVGKVALEERSAELQSLLLDSAEKVSAPARRERLAAIAAFLPLIPDTSLHFIPSILSEVVISCKEHNERARTTAFDLLVLMGQRMVSANGVLIDNSKVPHMPKDAPAATATIEEFFTMVSAGLAGSTPHMISASITAISRILYEFRDMLSPATLADLVQTMDLFLTSNNREIVKSVLGFVKVSVISLPTDLIRPRLTTLIPNLMIWSHEHKGHFRAKVKHILERMVRRFGFDVVNKNCPEADRKLINNIRKTKERAKKRRSAAKEEGESSDEDEQPSGRKGTGRFESEYDEAIYSSDDSEASESDNEVLGHAKKGGRKAGGNTYIMEDDGEPLDLLDRKALASISSTRPVKAKRATKSKAKVDADGRLILGRDSDDDGGAMDIDGEGKIGEEESGVGAYVAALKGKDVPKRGLRGKLKWSNKKGRDDDDDEDDDGDVDMDASASSAIKSKLDKGRRGDQKSRNGAQRGRGGKPTGKGGIVSGRRALGEGRRRGPSMAGRVGKPSKRGRR
ncbi:hypothetical protein VTK73DRAFT_3304 [Phialemonium thermophilum]|uniref:Ribosomal RNA-processing protein 12-like conserved domain-containing protein n=1 Tax=Phialemonium thermophilum TaxID=223376 RepID=A0ABR3Y220_9PEZI